MLGCALNFLESGHERVNESANGYNGQEHSDNCEMNWEHRQQTVQYTTSSY